MSGGPPACWLAAMLAELERVRFTASFQLIESRKLILATRSVPASQLAS